VGRVVANPKLRAPQMLTTSPAFYGTLRFTAVFTAVRPFSHIHSVHALLHYFSNSLTLSTPMSPTYPVTSGFCTQILYLLPHSRHLPCPAHLLSFQHIHYIRTAVQYHSAPNYTTSPCPCYHLPQYPKLEQHQPMFLPQCDRPNNKTTRQKIKNELHYNSVHLKYECVGDLVCIQQGRKNQYNAMLGRGQISASQTAVKRQSV